MLVAGCGSGGGTPDPGPDSCGAAATGSRPPSSAVPLVTVARVSPFTSRWLQTADILVYADSSAVGEPAVDASASAGPDLRLAYPAVSPRQASAIADCVLPDLVATGRALAGHDLGVPAGASGLDTTTVSIGAQEGHPAVTIEAPGLAATGSELTAAHRQARQELTDWITAVRIALRPTVTMPVDRLRLVELPVGKQQATERIGRAPLWTGAAPAVRAASADGRRYDEPCVVLTGDDALRAAASMTQARGTTDNRVDALLQWRFIVDGTVRVYGMVALAPGEGCV